MNSHEWSKIYNMVQSSDTIHTYFKETLSTFDGKEPKRALNYAYLLVEYLKMKVGDLPKELTAETFLKTLMAPPEEIIPNYKIVEAYKKAIDELKSPSL